MYELDNPISEEEVKEAINDMPSDKAPGLDGFTSAFFKKCWGYHKGLYLKEICPRGNNKVVILYFLIHDKGLLFMLELY